SAGGRRPCRENAENTIDDVCEGLFSFTHAYFAQPAHAADLARVTQGLLVGVTCNGLVVALPGLGVVPRFTELSRGCRNHSRLCVLRALPLPLQEACHSKRAGEHDDRADRCKHASSTRWGPDGV